MLALTVYFPGAWYNGLTAELEAKTDDLATLRFDGQGTVTVPLALVMVQDVPEAMVCSGCHREVVMAGTHVPFLVTADDDDRGCYGDDLPLKDVGRVGHRVTEATFR